MQDSSHRLSISRSLRWVWERCGVLRDYKTVSFFLVRGSCQGLEERKVGIHGMQYWQLAEMIGSELFRESIEQSSRWTMETGLAKCAAKVIRECALYVMGEFRFYCRLVWLAGEE